jgi:predicted nucleic acid-binding protein
MIADTTFASDYLHEQRLGSEGPATKLFQQKRAQNIRLTIITAGEVFVAFNSASAARLWLQSWKILHLHLGIVETAAAIDRELIRVGKRLGENDNWIAGFALFYREPLISRDEDFDRVAGLRRIRY